MCIGDWRFGHLMKRNFKRIGPGSVVSDLIFPKNPCRVAVMFASGDIAESVEVYPFTDGGTAHETFRPNELLVIYFNTMWHGDLPTMEWRGGNAAGTFIDAWEWLVPFDYLAKSLDDYRTDYGRSISEGGMPYGQGKP